MADTEANIKAGDTTAAADRVQGVLAAFRQIGLPLLQALSEAQAREENAEPRPLRVEAMTELVDSAVTLSDSLSAEFGAQGGQGGGDALDPGIRWALAGSAAQTVASAYRVSGRVLESGDIKQIADIARGLQDKFRVQMPPGNENQPNTVALFRARMMEAMAPVIGAIAEYSFGRAEHGLLAEVAERLTRTADQVTRALAPTGSSPEEWRMLCWHVLKASAQIYAEAHFSEADRLTYMDPDERATYFAQHDQIVPMTQVWQAFNQRVAMLATLATYLEVPESARLDEGGW